METPTLPSTSASEIKPEPLSLLDRLTGIVTGPGEVFTSIKDVPTRTSNWLLPVLLSSLAAAVYIWIAFSQPPVLRAVLDRQDAALQKQVASGKTTQAQADTAKKLIESISPILIKIGGAASASITVVAALFVMSLAFWLLLKFAAGASLSYMKVVEIAGLTQIINLLNILVRGWLVVWRQNLLVTASPTIFLASPSATNKIHVLLSFFDILDFWWLGIVALGISKVGSIRPRNAALITFGLWFAFRLVVLWLTPAQG